MGLTNFDIYEDRFTCLFKVNFNTSTCAFNFKQMGKLYNKLRNNRIVLGAS